MTPRRYTLLYNKLSNIERGIVREVERQQVVKKKVVIDKKQESLSYISEKKASMSI